MTTISSNAILYGELSEAVGETLAFNSAKYAYESGISYSKLAKLISLGVETELLVPLSGYDFKVDRSRLMPKRIGDISTEGFAEMLDDCSRAVLEYIFSCDTDPTRDKVLNQAPTFRKSRYESALDLLKSRRIVTELGGRVRANLTKETYELIRKVYKV